MNNMLDEDLKTETSGLRTMGLLTFLLFFVGLGVWSHFAKIEGAVIASGTVIISGQPKTLQNLDGGIVADILIKNGDHVSEGQTLLVLDSTELKANYDITQNRLRETIARRDRLYSERDGKTSVAWDTDIYNTLDIEPLADIQNGQKKLLEARRRTRSGQIAQLEERKAQLGNQIDGINAIIASRRKQTTTLEKELTGLQGLLVNGYTSENRVLNVERQVEELLGQTAQNKTEISRIENMISETGIQITQIQKEFDQQVFEEIRDVDLQLNDLRQQLVATKGQLGRVEIIAPISGTIHELSIFTKGGVITPGQPILQIVPDNSDMEFEVLVEPQFIDEIRLGQEASLFFSAFNARTTPNIDGVVDFVSLQTQIQENLGIPFYPVKIAISQEQIDRLNGQELISGMPFEAFFTTESRSPLNYLIKPLTDNLKRAGREQ